MKVAITAASGQLGSEIVNATAALVSPENVVGLARTPANARHLGVEIRPGDYDEPDVLAASLQGVDAVLLVSGEADNPSHYAEAAGRDHVSWSAYFADLAEQRPTS